VNKFMKPTIFSGRKEKVCYKLFSLLIVNAEKWAQNREVGGDANLLSLNFYVFLALSIQL